MKRNKTIVDPEKVIHVPPRMVREDFSNHPDPKKHQTVSFVKSGIRIVGYVAILFNPTLAVGLLVLSELVGIFEELV